MEPTAGPWGLESLTWISLAAFVSLEVFQVRPPLKSPGELLKLQMPRPHPALIKSESLGGTGSQYVF